MQLDTWAAKCNGGCRFPGPGFFFFFFRTVQLRTQNGVHTFQATRALSSVKAAPVWNKTHLRWLNLTFLMVFFCELEEQISPAVFCGGQKTGSRASFRSGTKSKNLIYFFLGNWTCCLWSFRLIFGKTAVLLCPGPNGLQTLRAKLLVSTPSVVVSQNGLRESCACLFRVPPTQTPSPWTPCPILHCHLNHVITWCGDGARPLRWKSVLDRIGPFPAFPETCPWSAAEAKHNYSSSRNENPNTAEAEQDGKLKHYFSVDSQEEFNLKRWVRHNFWEETTAPSNSVHSLTPSSFLIKQQCFGPNCRKSRQKIRSQSDAVFTDLWVNPWSQSTHRADPPPPPGAARQGWCRCNYIRPSWFRRARPKRAKTFTDIWDECVGWGKDHFSWRNTAKTTNCQAVSVQWTKQLQVLPAESECEQ